MTSANDRHSSGRRSDEPHSGARYFEPYFKGKRVLVTGHTGFKGSWLSLWLIKMGAKVSGYSLAPSTQPALFETLQLERRMTSIIGDIRDREKLREAFEAANPDIVFHLAAQPLVRRSYADPIETYSTNVMGTANVLDVIRTRRRPCIAMVATTDKVYENNERDHAYRENESLGGYDPYSSSKAAAELVVAAYRRSFFNSSDVAQHGVMLASARAGNVIGGGDWSDDRLIPDMVKAFSKHEPVRLRNPLSTRPWQHVLEPLAAYLTLAAQMGGARETLSSSATSPEAFDAFNFGPREADCWPVGRVVEVFAKEWGDAARVEIDDGPHVHEAGFLKLDSAKANRVLGWVPHWDLSTALHYTAAWYKTVATTPDKAYEFSLDQIREWESKRSC